MNQTVTRAIRGNFFDLTGCASRPEEIADRVRYIEDGALLLEEGRIVWLGPWQAAQARLPAGTPVEDYRGKLIVPGFIDTHIHYPQTEMVGAYGEQLLEWLKSYTFPTEAQYHCPTHSAEMSRFFIRQLLANGTTTALVFGTVHPQSVEALFTEADAHQMRLIAGKVMMDRNAPEGLLEDADTSYQQTRELIRRWHGRGRLGYALTPRFVPTSSPELLTAVRRLREEFPDTWVHTHLSENSDEVAWVRALYPDHAHYLGVYHDYGLTGKKSVFAHCLHLDEHEWACMAHTGSSIAFCPTSNLFLGSGLFRLKKAWEMQVRVGIGSDIGAGTTFSILSTLGEAYKVGQLQQYRLSAFEAFYHATLGGARALHLEEKIGNFEPGKEADFVVLDSQATPLQRLRAANSGTLAEKLFVLMTLGDDRNIHATWVNGAPVYRAGE
ncbi:guanine deaminase [Nissabacter sp. SGAir0207]|uniref:guanine deaminase n=1 Tax=Nissabacter sp. SGAir0207 TaxID=2126321 RepID=UPI0010CCCDDF|nr:guanine deaminase [Nissabacter sp. SGAir0207]QCR36128.1 guanine deaminase [Nissabacter sp. SGAir0207]